MPTAMTYDTLFGDLESYSERGYIGDTVVRDQIPSIINLAERDIATRLKLLGLINVVTDALVAGTPTYLKPDRWRATASINIAVGTSPTQEKVNLYPRSLEYCLAYWPNAEERAQPEFYADYDYNNWLIVPTPVANYPWEVNYWQQPPLLDSGNQTNWLTDYAPQALLYGALVQLLPFLKDGPWKEQWKAEYERQVGMLEAQDLQRIIDRTVVRRTV